MRNTLTALLALAAVGHKIPTHLRWTKSKTKNRKANKSVKKKRKTQKVARRKNRK